MGEQIAERIAQDLIDNCIVAGGCIEESFRNLLRTIAAKGPTAENLASRLEIDGEFSSRTHFLRKAQAQGIISPRNVNRLVVVLNRDEGSAYLQSYIGKWCTEWTTQNRRALRIQVV